MQQRHPLQLDERKAQKQLASFSLALSPAVTISSRLLKQRSTRATFGANFRLFGSTRLEAFALLLLLLLSRSGHR